MFNVHRLSPSAIRIAREMLDDDDVSVQSFELTYYEMYRMYSQLVYDVVYRVP